ncbi:MAG: methionine gamma-lyase family protein [Clostridiales bacterium]|nr:methionine gamma-lyase family protein [Clostridiales bacterium]
MREFAKQIEDAYTAMERSYASFAIISRANTIRVLEAMRTEKLAYEHFNASSGYGYHDAGRDKLEAVVARVFGTEAALMRQQIVSGSHAISLALHGNLLPGDELVTLGLPYDTLQTIIGMKSSVPGSLAELGITHRVLEIDFTQPDTQAIVAALAPHSKMLCIQRSRGYSWRKSLNVMQIAQITQAVKAARPDVIVFVDNCYGEMVEQYEPSHFGADLLAGSLIKNLGAGLTPCGGYVVGRAALVERAACKLTVAGAGRGVGPSLLENRLYYQALFMAPSIVAEALAGAVFTACMLQSRGIPLSPLPEESRTDIIQCAQMPSEAALIAFCQGIQRYSPVDSFVSPLPWPMPGYNNDIIMASGGFIQGSSIELSADAPIRPPYLLFIQGGLSRHHVAYAVENTLRDMIGENLI